ncbi:hypothetical protein ACFFRR_009008, partial [Megaselia abdita]
MEKAKAYIKKNELRGGSLSSTEAPNYPPPSSSAPILSQSHHHYPSSQQHQQHQQYYHHFQQSLNNRSTSNPSAHDNYEMPAVTSSSVCFVCGAKCPCRDRLRPRPNPDKPSEPFFQFLERHEPPDDYQHLQPNQQYVISCVLCHTLLTNQWEAYEKEGKPYNERIYHFKRVDGKSFIGADMSTQGEYAAQMLGLSAEHITSNVPSHQWQPQQQRSNVPHPHSNESHPRPTSRNDAPQQQQPQPQQNRSLPQSGSVANNGNSNNSSNNSKSNNSHYQHQQQQLQQQHHQQHRSGISSFAQQKFKLGQIQQQQQQQQASQPQPSSQPPKPPTPQQYGDALDLRNRSSAPLQPTPVSTPTPQGPIDVGILDLSMPDKNSSTEVCYVCGDEQRRGSLIELCTITPLKDSGERDKPFFPIFNDNHPRPARSRPKDPRGMIQACRICYDHLMQQWNHYE